MNSVPKQLPILFTKKFKKKQEQKTTVQTTNLIEVSFDLLYSYKML